MKKAFLILTLIITSATLSAQSFYRGLALGADRDTIKFIIASPFDNWYINIGGGIQTFIGNEIESSARHNKVNFSGHAEIGKWIIPDVAVSLRLSFFNVDGQSRYSRHPFIDFTGVPTHVDPSSGVTYYEYQPYHAYALALLGYVSMDWTNLFNGYEQGKRTKLHWRTGIGLGMSMLFGNQVNPNVNDNNVGDFRRNFELAFSFSFGPEYALTEHTALFGHLELFGSESTWDWSPYDNSHSIFDIIPSFNAGMRFNIISRVKKYHPETRSATRDTVYHEFLPVTNTNVVRTLNGKIDHIRGELAQMEQEYNTRSLADSLHADSLNRELSRLQDKLNQYETEASGKKRPTTLIDELLDINEALNLPYTIVYFELDKYDLDYNARKKLQLFANTARNLPDTMEYYMIGAADSLTGSILHNQWLSERRCEAAFKMLTENFGVSGNQLLPIYAGGINDYTPQENNRMVLVIQRTPVTEEIVNRWLRMSQERLEQDSIRRRR